MAKNKKNKKNRILKSEAEQKAAADPQPGGGMYAFRETIESVVIAFVLAFLFRTFEAEAFVIPTGSMSPSLQGQHKDVCCSECGYRFRASASTEGDEKQAALASGNLQQALGYDVVAAMCPMCRQTMAVGPDMPVSAPGFVDTSSFERQTTYPGDRILVNKYAYNDRDPDRWDVVVFKFPGDGEMNYIKRLVGLPNETLRIYQGDVFIRDDEAGSDFEIARKPPNKVEAMLQPVHDTDYDSETLYQTGWPLRWESEGGWNIEAKPDGKVVKQTFTTDESTAENETAWLRYRHYIPSNQDWLTARRLADGAGDTRQSWPGDVRPELISDFNPYNTQLLRFQVNRGGWGVSPNQLGTEWVSDLAVRCEVEVVKPDGSLTLDLVEAGRHFSCEIDLSTGKAKLLISNADDFESIADTSVRGTGSYELLFANVDDQLLLWVDGTLVEFPNATFGESEIGPRDQLLPRTSDEDPGDLAPVGIGVQGAKVTVERLEVLRDIYYIATHHDNQQAQDYAPPGDIEILPDGTQVRPLRNPRDLFRDPDAWPRFATRLQQDFEIEKEQLFVMGDNSPASLDCRLWTPPQGRKISHPGGPYLDRRLLIGKAVCVFWPHSWGEIPGLRRLPGFPNFGDMRLVR